MSEQTNRELLEFIHHSPTAFHAVDNIRKTLMEQDFVMLLEGEDWDIRPGGKYFVTRNDSALIAFKVGEDLEHYSFNITAAHSDSPSFRLKDLSEMKALGHYMKLDTEGYGGMICYTWLDRPLSIAGRVLVREGDSLVTKLVNIDRDLLMIPSLAIHQNRSVNDGFEFNKQVDLLPLLGGKDSEEGGLKKIIAQELGIDEESILGSDLSLYNRQEGTVWGANNEFLSSPQLDDLQCVFSGMKALLAGGNRKSVDVLAVFDNEEVGSGTKQGAASTFLPDTLHRVNAALGYDEAKFLRAMAGSFMVSADNAHAVHPNHPEKSDEINRVYMNEGVVVKRHAGQKYTTDGVSIAVFRALAEKAGVPLQYFANRSDVAGGSTLGNLEMAQLSMNAVDIGLPQLAMHSSYETAGTKDTDYMIAVLTEFYNSHIEESALHTLQITK